MELYRFKNTLKMNYSNTILTSTRIPRIYAYTEPQYENKTWAGNRSGKGWIKVGETDRTAQERIKEQFPINKPETPYSILLDEIAIREDGTYFGDKDVHTVHYWIYTPGYGASMWDNFHENGVMTFSSVIHRFFLLPFSEYTQILHSPLMHQSWNNFVVSISLIYDVTSLKLRSSSNNLIFSISI